MKYLLLICAEGTDTDEHESLEQDQAYPTERTNDAIASNTDSWDDCLPEATQRHGILVTGSPAQPAMEATLQFRGRDVVITDGPYAHVHGHITGFNVIEGDQIEEFAELAARVAPEGVVAADHQAPGKPGRPGAVM